MATIELPYFRRSTNQDGSTRFYWEPSKALRKAGWRPERLPDLELDAIAAARAKNERVEQWQLGVEGVLPDAAAEQLPRAAGGKRAVRPHRLDPKPDSVDAMIVKYRTTRFYLQLSPKSKRSYEQCLERISDWIGDKPRRAITSGMANDHYEEHFKRAPAFANQVMRVASALWKAGRAHDLVVYNPFYQLGLVGLPFTGKIWPRAALPVFEQAAGELGWQSVYSAIKLDEWLGQREADVLALPRAVRKDGGLDVLQQKTDQAVDLPVGMVTDLTGVIDLELERQARRKVTSTSHLLLREDTGQPWDEHGFRHAFADVRRRAAMIRPHFETDYIVRGRDPNAEDARILRTSELKFMYLRHTAVTRMVEARCTDDLICSVSGHSPSSIVQIKQRYVIRTGEAARQAFRLRLEHEAQLKKEARG